MLPSVPAPAVPEEGPVRRMPPAPALVALPLAVLSALIVGLFLLVVWALSGGEPGRAGWLIPVLLATLLVALLVGAVLLGLGRSWLVLALAAGGMAALLLVGLVLANWGSGPSAAALYCLVPGTTAVLATRRGVRGWVAARRRARRLPVAVHPATAVRPASSTAGDAHPSGPAASGDSLSRGSAPEDPSR